MLIFLLQNTREDILKNAWTPLTFTVETKNKGNAGVCCLNSRCYYQDLKIWSQTISAEETTVTVASNKRNKTISYKKKSSEKL